MRDQIDDLREQIRHEIDEITELWLLALILETIRQARQ